MKCNIKYWNYRMVALSIITLILAVINFNFVVDIRTNIILSCTALFVWLIVCFGCKAAKTDVDVCTTPIIVERKDGYTIDYSIKTVGVKDVKLAMEKLQEWKEETGFSWLNANTQLLNVYFTDLNKTSISVVDVEAEKNIFEKYIGNFSYYMKDGKRMFKVDDIQLGALDASCIQDISSVSGKLCSVITWDNQIVYCEQEEGGISNG